MTQDQRTIVDLESEIERLREELDWERARFAETERSWYMIGKCYYWDDRGRERYRWAEFDAQDDPKYETLRDAIDARLTRGLAPV